MEAPRGDEENTKNTEAALLKRRLLSGGAWALGGRALLAVTGLAVNALLGRLLAPEDLGVFFLAFSIVLFCAILGSLGLATAALRFVAENLGLNNPGQIRSVVVKVFALGISGSLAASLAYLLFGQAVVASLFRVPALTAVAGLMAVWILATTLQHLLAETFRGFYDIRLATIFGKSTAGFGSLATGVLLAIGLAAMWIFEGSASFTSVVYLSLGSSVAGMLLAAWFLKRKVAALPTTPEPGGDVRTSRILTVAGPLLVTDLTLFALTQADLWIVGAFLPQSDVAVYGAAVRLVTFVILPLLIVNAVVPPMISDKYAQGRTAELQNLLRATATLAGLPALFVLGGFILFGEAILGLVYGDFYREGGTILVILTLGYLVSTWTGSCAITLALTGHQKMLMTITIITGALMITGGILSVNRYGMAGVAVATALGIALQSILMLLGARFATGMWTHISITGVSYMKQVLRGG